MSKEELQAANERLAAEVAAWRELATVIGGAGLTRPPAGEESIAYLRQCSYRLENVTLMTGAIMKYAGESWFPKVVLNTTETMRGIIATLQRYETAAAPERETAEPVPQCDSGLPLRHGAEILCTDDEGHDGDHTALNGKYRWVGTGADARQLVIEAAPERETAGSAA